MRRTATKIYKWLFIGLLAFAVPFSHASAQSTKESSSSLPPFEDANKFMSRTTQGFDLDLNEANLGNLINCGSRRCNIKDNKCLRKENWWKGAGRSTWRNLVALAETAGGVVTTAGSAVVGGAATVVSAVATAGTATVGAAVATTAGVSGGVAMTADGIGRFQTSTVYDYVCIQNDKVSDYTAKGWVDVSKNNDNVSYVENRVSGNNNTKVKEVEECYSAKSVKGEVTRYCYKIIDGQVEVRSATKNWRICEVVPVKWYNNRQCRFCSLLGIAYAASEHVTVTAYTNFAHSFAMLIIIGMALWLAFKTLVFVSSMTKQDAAKYITEIVKQSYKFMIAYFALVYYADIFNFIIRPLLNAGLQFSEEFISVQNVFDRFEVASLEELRNKADLSSDYKRNLDNIFYNFAIYAKLENFAYNVNLNFTMMQTIGQILRCLGGNYIMFFLGEDGWYFGLGFACIIYGIILNALGWLLSLAFVFYIFDAVIQLGIVGGLLPFLVASWPFKITAKYTSTGFKMLLNSIFNFMMMGLVVKIIIELINKGLALNTESKDGEGGTNGFTALADAIDRLDTEALKEMVNVLSVGFLIFMFACVMGFLLLGRVSELTDRFASGGMKAVAPSIATMGASTVVGGAKKLTQPLTNSIEKGMSEGVSKGMQKLLNGRSKGGAPSSTPKNKPKPPTSVGGGKPSKPENPDKGPVSVGGNDGRKNNLDDLE